MQNKIIINSKRTFWGELIIRLERVRAVRIIKLLSNKIVLNIYEDNVHKYNVDGKGNEYTLDGKLLTESMLERYPKDSKYSIVSH